MTNHTQEKLDFKMELLIYFVIKSAKAKIHIILRKVLKTWYPAWRKVEDFLQLWILITTDPNPLS
jgi:hypothetical protein